jgi:curved DNA-binding protein CbpA
MILLEINDESGITHYEVLEISLELLAGLDEKKTAKKIRDAAKKARNRYDKLAQKGDKEAEDRMKRINQAETVLKTQEERQKYNTELESGKGATLEVLRVRPIAPTFFWDRNVRFRVIERLIQATRMI